MTDKELAMRLTGALDDRIARASSAPVAREVFNHLPSADTVTTPQVKTVSARQMRWKGAIAAVLVLGMLGGIGLAASKLLDRSGHTQAGESGNNPVVQTTEAATQNAEPLPDAELPVVSFEEDTKTLRVVGTGNYDRIDLSRLPEAANMIVEDDDFEYRILPTVLFGKDSPIEDPVSYLPGYLEHVDQSLATIRQFVADNAPNEDVVAQTQKKVKLSLNAFGRNNISNSYTIDLVVGGSYRQPGLIYTIALMNLNASTAEWKQVAYASWVENTKNPYSPGYFVNPEVDASEDYLPYSYYFQAGGNGDWRDVNTRALLDDVISWCNLVFGRDWGGNTSESGQLTDMFSFLDPEKEENRLSEREASSLLNYLAEQYGTDKVTAYCFDACTFEEAFGTDFSAAKAAWEQYLMNRFGDGSEEPAELPQVSFDEDTKTLRIVGTGNYDRVDFSRLPEAETLIVEDDDFSYTILPALLYGDDSYIKDDVAGYLPGYLDRVDKSLATIRQFVADTAPNEDVIAQTQKPVRLELKSFKFESYGNSENQIELDLGSGYRWHGPFYTMALMDPESAEWQHIGYAYWVGSCVDPYCSIYTKTGSVVPPDPDYAYIADYYRLGGTEDWRDLNNQRLLADANSWYNLVYGTTWGGNESERGCVSNSHWFNSKNRTKEGNKRPLTEAISLLNYLAEQYGADKVTAYCFDTCSFEEAFGMDYATARAAWEQSLLERFGNGSENP